MKTCHSYSWKKNVDYNHIVAYGEIIKKLADEFVVGEQTVRDLIKRKDDIFKFISCAESSTKLSAVRKTMKKSLSNMEFAFFENFKQKHNKGNPISGPIICEKAKWFPENL